MIFKYIFNVQDDLSHLYPTLNDYMGLEFTQEMIAANMPEYLHSHNQVKL